MPHSLLCRFFLKAARENPGSVMNILFLCTGNSARSILAEALANQLGQGRITAYSAGSFPKGKPHPLAIELLKQREIETAGLRSKSWNEFAAPGAPVLDAVVTVCDAAAQEVCPIWPVKPGNRGPAKAHWGIPDPAAVTGSKDEKRAAFLRAYETLRLRIAEFLTLPVQRLSPDDMRDALNGIAEIIP